MRKYTIEEAKQIFKEHGYELLANEYPGIAIKMPCICKCGKNDMKSLDKIKQNRQCYQCGVEKQSAIKRLNYNDVKLELKNLGYELIDTEYKSVNKKLLMKCTCGTLIKLTLAGARVGNQCEKCFKNKLSGINHWNYNPYLSDEERQARRERSLTNGPQKTWSKLILRRDNYTCQKCKVVGTKLNAHHLESWAKNPELRLEKNNGVCLCVSCHNEFHFLYGKITNRSMYEEWLVYK